MSKWNCFKLACKVVCGTIPTLHRQSARSLKSPAGKNQPLNGLLILENSTGVFGNATETKNLQLASQAILSRGKHPQS